MRLNIANATWINTDPAEDIFGSEVLDTRIDATSVTTTYNTTTNQLDFTLVFTIMTPVNTSFTFNRTIVLRGGQAQAKWATTYVSATTMTLTDPNPFIIGDRIYYNNAMHILTGVAGQDISVASGPFNPIELEVIDGTALITVAGVLSAADTTFIPANSSISLTVTGSSITGV